MIYFPSLTVRFAYLSEMQGIDRRSRFTSFPKCCVEGSCTPFEMRRRAFSRTKIGSINGTRLLSCGGMKSPVQCQRVNHDCYRSVIKTATTLATIEALNSACFCISLDPEALTRALDSEVGQPDLSEMIRDRCPFLFATTTCVCGGTSNCAAWRR